MGGEGHQAIEPGGLSATHRLTAEELASLARQVIDSYRDRGLTLASCESITAGGIGWMLTTVPGSSQVYRGGLITYASELKARLAGVDAEFIAAHGVINEQTSRQMALGAAQACQADACVSVTGTAGPSGEDGVAPGVVWMGRYFRGTVSAQLLRFTGGRDAIRRATIAAALRYLLAAVA